MATLSKRPGAPSQQVRFEVLGRLLHEIRGTILDKGLDHWLDLQGGIVLEWSNGPTAREAREHLTRSIIDRGTSLLHGSGDLRAEDLADDPLKKDRSPDLENWLFLWVREVEVQFRALAPVGLAAAEEREWARLRTIVHGPNDQ